MLYSKPEETFSFYHRRKESCLFCNIRIQFLMIYADYMGSFYVSPS